MLRLHALGGLSVRVDGQPLAGAAAQPRRLAVLALLARAGERGITREKLLALLWPDADSHRGPRTLAQALYALRRDLGNDDAIVGVKELRLDPSVVATDVGDFTAALATGALESAANAYSGAFLDGFHLPGASEFERWADDERQSLAHQHADVLERLARSAMERGDAAAASRWWRRLASLDPLNARIAIGLMQALTAAGDRSGALNHARIYEALLSQELDLPPDREVVALAERLRREADLPQASVPPAPPPTERPAAVPVFTEARASDAAVAVAAEPAVVFAPPPNAPEPAPAAAPVVEPQATDSSRGWLRIAAGVVGAAALVMAAIVGVRGIAKLRASRETAIPVVAIGRIASYRMDSTGGALAAPVADLLATNLARVTGIRVVSAARLYELLGTSGSKDTSSGAFVAAARRAGATELVDGTLFVRPGGKLRLDLRRTDLTTGDLRVTHTAEGGDVFALVDSGTAMLVASLGGSAPKSSVAEVTTRSVVAYRLYSEGLARQAAMDAPGAARLFTAALAEDSTFALAAYHLSETAQEVSKIESLLERALRLSESATDRERLMIRAGWAFRASSPELVGSPGTELEFAL